MRDAITSEGCEVLSVRSAFMFDVICLALTLGLFGISLAYLNSCEHL